MPPELTLIVYPSLGYKVGKGIAIEGTALGRVQPQKLFESESFQVERVECVDGEAIPEATLFRECVEEGA